MVRPPYVFRYTYCTSHHLRRKQCGVGFRGLSNLVRLSRAQTQWDQCSSRRRLETLVRRAPRIRSESAGHALDGRLRPQCPVINRLRDKQSEQGHSRRFALDQRNDAGERNQLARSPSREGPGRATTKIGGRPEEPAQRGSFAPAPDRGRAVIAVHVCHLTGHRSGCAYPGRRGRACAWVSRALVCARLSCAGCRRSVGDQRDELSRAGPQWRLSRRAAAHRQWRRPARAQPGDPPAAPSARGRRRPTRSAPPGPPRPPRTTSSPRGWAGSARPRSGRWRRRPRRGRRRRSVARRRP